MKCVKNSNLPLIIGGIVLLTIGLLIGFNINKKEVYAPREKFVSTTDVNTSNNEVEVISSNLETTEEQTNDVDTNINNQASEDKASSTNNSKDNQSNKKTSDKSSNNEETYSNKDTDVINSLESSLTKVNSGDASDKSFADSAKGVFVTIVDFLFYDGEINGVTFSELTDAGKAQVLKLANKIDNAIESKLPGYKETISSAASSAFNKASEVIKKGANNLNDFAKEKLGEENYQSIIDAKDELVFYTKNALNFIGDVGGKLFDSAKDKLNNWYQDFKNN